MVFTVNNNKNQNIGEKSQEYLNYSIDILKWKMIRIYINYSQHILCQRSDHI